MEGFGEGWALGVVVLLVAARSGLFRGRVGRWAWQLRERHTHTERPRLRGGLIGYSVFVGQGGSERLQLPRNCRGKAPRLHLSEHVWSEHGGQPTTINEWRRLLWKSALGRMEWRALVPSSSCGRRNSKAGLENNWAPLFGSRPLLNREA